MPEIAIRKTNRGKVIGIGRDVIEVIAGDLVYFNNYASEQRIREDKKNLCIVCEKDILAVER